MSEVGIDSLCWAIAYVVKEYYLCYRNRQRLSGMTIHDDIHKALSVLRAGGVILYPTDTVWGIGCDATSSEAVRRIFEIKRRPESKALISLVGSWDMLEQTLGRPVAKDVLDFIASASRPVTVIYENVDGLAPELLAADGSAGIRMTGEEFSSRLCQALGHPLVSTSANVSGQPAPAFFNEISPEIIAAVDYVVSYRRDDLTASAPSMVVKINGENIDVLRS